MSACPECHTFNSKVIDSRKQMETGWTMRRRECYECGHRWTTYEVPTADISQQPEDSHGSDNN